MAELFPSDTALNALSGTADAEQAVPYIPVGLSPYHTEFYQMLYRLLDVARRAGDLRVYKDDAGALKFGVRPGRYLNGDTPVDYSGTTGQDLTDNATNYIYLTADGTLTVSTGGFPTPSDTPHLPLATIATGTVSAAGVAGQYDFQDITDYRGRALLAVAGGSVSSFSRSQLETESLVRYQVPLGSCRRDGVDLLAYTGSSSQFHLAGPYWGTGLSFVIKSAEVGSTTQAFYLAFEFVLPPEYVAGEDVKLVVHTRIAGTGSLESAILDAQVYKLADDGTAGSDLCETSEQNVTASWADVVFEITESGLAPGDRLMVQLKARVEEGGDNPLWAEIGNIEMQLDIKG